MKKRYLFLSIPLLFLFLFVPRFLQAKSDPFDPLPTEFSYSTTDLCFLRSTHLITLERIDKWEASLQKYFKEKNIPYLPQLRFYTYLYLAQRDAAFLSFNVHHFFIGSLDPLTRRVVETFFPDFPYSPDFLTDLYSEELAKKVWEPYLFRFQQENASTSIFQPCGENSISEKIQAVAKWLPWTSPLPQPPPPSENLEEQVECMEKQRSHLTEKQKELAYAWAGEKGFLNQWWDLANLTMRKNGTPLGKTLLTRSLLTMSLYDAVIAAFKAKYTYCLPRPFLVDPHIHPLIHKPDSPSYPSGHAAQAGAAEIVLCFLIPEECESWSTLANQCTQSRIWAGVHTPQDAFQGKKLGEEIGISTIRPFLHLFPKRVKNVIMTP